MKSSHKGEHPQVPHPLADDAIDLCSGGAEARPDAAIAHTIGLNATAVCVCSLEIAITAMAATGPV
jgi:hypothetical protein